MTPGEAFPVHLLVRPYGSMNICIRQIQERDIHDKQDDGRHAAGYNSS